MFGDVRGFWEAWQRFGRLQWAELFEDTIRLCFEGFVIAEALGEELARNSKAEEASNNVGNMRCVRGPSIRQHKSI